MQASNQEVNDFCAVVWSYFADHRRDMPWRHPDESGRYDPYAIMVSEIMLQQTQVSRVIPKYHEFMAQFPTVADLASASQAAVLTLWNGLGYNRRARFLWLAAQQIVTQYGGVVPSNVSVLITLPGIGKNTAGAICAYAYNDSVTFIETNIRSVILHHFFEDSIAVPDSAVLECLERIIIAVAPTAPAEYAEEGCYRTWYWAMMDYGSFLKESIGNANRRSAHYGRQGVFEGSRRQLRGAIVRQLATAPLTYEQLSLQMNDDRLESVLNDLIGEGLIRATGNTYSL